MLAVVVALSIAYWYISVPIVLLTAIAVGVTVHRHHVQRERQVTSRVVASSQATPAQAVVQQRVPRPARTPPLTMPADTFKVGSLVHLEKGGTRATYFVDHGRTPDEIVLKRVTPTPSGPDA